MAEERRRIPPDPPPRASTDPPPVSARTGERINVEHDPKVHKEPEVVKKERPERVEHVRRPAGLPAAIKRISWGAILAGTIIALVTQLALSLLGLAIGLGTVDPTAEANPFSGLATGAGIWLAVSTILSLLAGGFTAARLAGLPKRTDGILHGLVTWGLVTLLAVFLTSSAVGRLVSGAVGVVGEGLQVIGQGVSSVASGVTNVAPEAADAAQQLLEAENVTLEEIKREAVQLLTVESEPSQTGTPPSQAGQQTGAAQQQDTLQVFGAVQQQDTTVESFGPEQVTGGAQAQTQDTTVARAQAEREVRNALDRLRTEDGQPVSQEIRGAIVSVLAENTRLSEAEARQTVGQYEQRLQQARQEASQTLNQVEQQAVQVGDAAAANLSKAALWGFIAMLVGALASAAGGALGAPKDLLVSPAVTRDDLVTERT